MYATVFIASQLITLSSMEKRSITYKIVFVQNHILLDPARLPAHSAQLAGRCGHRHWNSDQRGKKLFCIQGRLEQPRLNKNLLYWRDKPKKPTKKGPLSNVLFETRFASVSTVSRGHPSLRSLVSLLQPVRRAAVLDQTSSLRPPCPITSLHCDVVLFLWILFYDNARINYSFRLKYSHSKIHNNKSSS
jgi:hypothetical protein